MRLHTSRASYYKAVDEVAKALARSLVELDGQKSGIQEQVASMTIEDVRRALPDSSSRRAALLSIGGSWHLTNYRCCWELIVITLDGGGVKSYSSILIIKALMDHVHSAIKKTNMNQVRLQGVHVHAL